MKLYDNNEYRETFMELVYDLLRSDGTNDRANLIVDVFDMAPAVEAELLPPNDPLTLAELREMDGEPVWRINGNGGQWGLVHVFSAEGETYVECVTKTGFTMDDMTYGAMGIYAWLAYRRKLEEAAP